MNIAILAKLHRWIGFALTILILLLCVTGLLLNHTDALGLGKKSMPGWMAALFYDIEMPVGEVLALSDVVIESGQAGMLKVNGEHIASCEGQLVGVVQIEEQVIVACSFEVIFLSTDGELIEQQGRSLGIPMPLNGISISGDAVHLATPDSTWQLDPLTLSVVKLYENTIVEPVAASVDVLDEDFSLERIVLDLHAGRIVDGWGVWLMDLTAIGLILLIISGYLAWYKKKKLLEELE